MTYQTNNLVYHYTSLEVLLKLLDNIKGGKIFFHASYIQYMNDPEEFKYGINKIINFLPQFENKHYVENKNRLSNAWNDDKLRTDYFKMLKETFRLPFVVCFCNNRDYLPQWGMYGNQGKGVSLGFNLQDYYQIKEIDNKKILCITDIEDCKLRAIKVSYKHISNRHFFMVAVGLYYQHYLDIIKNIKDEEIKRKIKWDTITNIAFYLFPLIKHKAYAYELESRIIYPCNRIENIKFKINSTNKLVPYVNVGIETGRFKKIVIGPCCEFESTKSMLETKLKFMGLEHVKILQSKIPYRA